MITARGVIKDIEETRKKVEQLGAEFKNYYCYTDIVFVPKSGKIDLSREFIRLRVYTVNNWPTKNIVLIHKVTEWLPHGKVDDIILRKEFDNAEEAFDFIRKRFGDFLIKGFEYFREGWEYHLNGMRIFIEDIKGFKPTIEVEAISEEALDEMLEKLGIIERLSDSVPEIMRKVLCARM